MAKFCLISNGVVRSGDVNLNDIDFDTASNSDFSLNRENGILRTDAPFQMIRITNSPEQDPSYQITVIAPGHYAHFSASREDYHFILTESMLHQHNTFELVFVLEGELYQRIEAERHLYSAGSCMLLNRNVRHAEEYGSFFCTVSLSLSHEFFHSLLRDGDRHYLQKTNLLGDNTDLQRFLDNELFGEGQHEKQYIDFIPVKTSGDSNDPLRAQFEELSRLLLSEKPGFTYFFRGVLCEMLSLLSRKDLYNTVPIAIGTKSESALFSRINHILEESNGRLTRRDLERELLYSGNYLNRIVRTYSGMNLTQYALSYTLRKVAELLVSEDLSVTELMHDFGFTNRNTFYRAFEKYYGCSPRQYRLQNRHQRDS